MGRKKKEDRKTICFQWITFIHGAEVVIPRELSLIGHAVVPWASPGCISVISLVITLAVSKQVREQKLTIILLL